ncbi:capsular polysaccharide transport system ATP-binding protein [Paraburkholderia atlantica]
MIQLENVSKVYRTRQGRRTVLDKINLRVEKGEKVGILGRNGAGKSTMIRMVSGAELPTSGSIVRGMSVSWPLAFGGAFQGSLTGMDNLRFICRIYGADAKIAEPFVHEFSELGYYLREPVKAYSSGMRARLAFAISMAIEFDCFLIDEIIAVGDSRFHAKCHHELFERRKDRSLIIVSHDAGYIREHCDRASVLIEGKLYNFESIDDAYTCYQDGVAPSSSSGRDAESTATGADSFPATSAETSVAAIEAN